ncbi:EamA family transporter [Blautia obeum]|uniref:EamA family transporter n=1 Tax=Blautia obeum TaxID=40520 RepID=UPI003D087C71
MWLGFAVGSAFFAGITSILAKCGIKKTDSNVATAVRTFVVLIFSWLMVFVVGSQNQLTTLSLKNLLFLVLSGLATGASWLCYFHALQIGNINKVVPVDKFSTVLTIILAFILLGEPVSIYKLMGIVGIGVGTWLMIQKKETTEPKKEGKGWFFYALLSAVFASLTSILGKVGITGVDSNLGTAIRTIVVLLMAWVVVFVTKKQNDVRYLDRKELRYIVLSGFATGASWLCYYRALQTGPASLIVPIDKLSIVVSIIFSYIVFKEKLSKKALFGLLCIVGGTLVMLVG